jgi:hypothetical protein
MPFATEADRANCLAAALTVVLRNHWLGGKPIFVATATKPHSGKDTLVDFVRGSAPGVSISYQSTDWALETFFVAQLKHNPELGLISIENARLGQGDKQICSGFVERFSTTPELSLDALRFREPIRIYNDKVVAISTNHGDLSADWLTRANHSHLSPMGDIASRVSPIGDPRHEFLPNNRAKLEAVKRGMITRWLAQSMPLDETAKHPFLPWARSIGGILLVNGVKGFQVNYAQRLTQDDPERRGLARLGADAPNEWRSASDWTQTAIRLGLTRSILPHNYLENAHSMATGLGRVLTRHQEETLIDEGDDASRTFRLERARRRFEGGQDAEVRYRFTVIASKPVPEDVTND